MQTFTGWRVMLSGVRRDDAATSHGDDGVAAAAEAALIARARQGDRDAFDDLVRLHLPRVWAVVWRMLRQREDTEDVVQEVFLAAFQGLPGYRGEARLSTWLHRIAVSRAINHLQRAEERASRARVQLDDVLDGLPVAAGPGESPLQALQAGELQRRLADCLEKLPGTFRAILALRDVDETPYEGIAATLGIALGTVRSRLARARLALRQCVSGERA
jgi:RNA polymerase sigma-70 factor (ECF subfamily)